MRTRTKQQATAGKIDAELFWWMNRLRYLGYHESAKHVAAARAEVREHMHPEDREATE